MGVFRPGFLSARHAERLGINLVPLEQFSEIASFLFGRACCFAHVAMVLGHEPDQVIRLRRLTIKSATAPCKLTVWLSTQRLPGYD